MVRGKQVKHFAKIQILLIKMVEYRIHMETDKHIAIIFFG